MKIKKKITPLRYPGGKSNAISFLNAYFPSEFSEYREPFFGGGSVGLYLMQTKKNVVYHLNDLFFPVYCFWNTLYDSSHKMVKFLLDKKRMYSNKEDARKLYLWCKDKISDADEFETACLWYILNKTSYSGMSMIGSYSPLAWDQNFTEKCINNITNISQLMHSVKEVKITNTDYSNLLENTDTDTFIFLDPPYKIPYNLYGKNGDMHKTFDHFKFCEAVKKCNHNWMITYNNDDEIKSWLSGYKQKSWFLTYTMKSANREKNVADVKISRENNKTEKTGRKGEELLIWNFNETKDKLII